MGRTQKNLKCKWMEVDYLVSKGEKYLNVTLA
jgi:hypothetical protein